MKPRAFVYEVSARCDLSCAYCYNAWRDRQGARPRELPSEDAARVILSIASTGAESLCFAGGEPTLRDDLPSLVAKAAGAGLRVGVATNGLRLDERAAATLAESGAVSALVSLPALDDGAYRSRCGRPGFAAAKRAILSAKRAGLAVAAGAVASAESAEELPDIAMLAFALGAVRFEVNRFAAIGAGARSAARFSLADLAYERCLDGLELSAARTGMEVAVTTPVPPCAFERSRWPTLRFANCSCAREKWCVGPDGSLRACEQSPVSLGSLLSEPFETLSMRAEDFRASDARAECLGCPDYARCGGGCRFIGRTG
jgi:radical SAM protein with 4Fe4S-binding SPASM domain